MKASESQGDGSHMGAIGAVQVGLLCHAGSLAMGSFLVTAFFVRHQVQNVQTST